MKREEFLKERLLSFKEFEDGWCGTNSKKFKEAHIKKAIKEIKPMLRRFKSVGFAKRKVHVVPTASGQIQFEAESDTTYLEIMVEK